MLAVNSSPVPVEPPTLLIVGCGYVGRVVARNALQRGQGVYALTRSEPQADALRTLGIEPLVAHWLEPDRWPALPPAIDQILVAVPHREDRELGVQTHVTGLQNLLAKVKSFPTAGQSKLVYLSSTGVYGDCDGETVDEDTPPSPTRLGPQLAVAAEDWLQANYKVDRLTILRLAGIYGPGRVPLAQKLRDGEVLNVPRHGQLNLAHVDDIAAMIDIAFARSLQRSLYVFSDGQPVPRQDFYQYLAELCGVNEVCFGDESTMEQPSESENSRKRRATNKKVDPKRLVGEVGYRYRYPSYREGLVDALGP